MSFSIVPIAIFCFCIVAVLVRSRPLRRFPLPPGPPADPLIGHLRIIPTTGLDSALFEWSKTYGDFIRVSDDIVATQGLMACFAFSGSTGDVMQLRLPGRSIIALNSHEAAADLLDKRSHNYSDRQRFPVLEIIGWSTTLLTSFRYGDKFRRHRKLFQHFSQKQCDNFRETMVHVSHQLLKNLYSNPKGHDQHFKRFATGIIVKICYGYTVPPNASNDPYVEIGDSAVYVLTNIGQVGNTAVDFFPILKYFPSWFPGTFYAERARSFRSIVQRMLDFPFTEVQQQMAQGTAEPSFLSHMLEKFNHQEAESDLTEHDIKGATMTMYAGGADTTASTLAVFLLAMVLFPECQKEAQQELDKVVGIGRLPSFGDRQDLPYINNLILECYRWNPIVPLGIPHTSVADDIYRGMFIPKGSIIIANTRGIFSDERVYANSMHFNPDRYFPKPVGNGEPVPTAHFGYGRRACPGRHLADMSVFIAVASVLSTFNISKVIGEDGKEIIPEVEMTTGFSSHPKEYKCVITPRNASSQALLDEISEF